MLHRTLLFDFPQLDVSEVLDFYLCTNVPHLWFVKMGSEITTTRVGDQRYGCSIPIHSQFTRLWCKGFTGLGRKDSEQAYLQMTWLQWKGDLLKFITWSFENCYSSLSGCWEIGLHNLSNYSELNSDNSKKQLCCSRAAVLQHRIPGFDFVGSACDRVGLIGEW